MTKPEIRKNDEDPNDEIRTIAGTPSFGFRHSSFIRISGFVIRAYLATSFRDLQQSGHFLTILVAPAGEVDDDDLVLRAASAPASPPAAKAWAVSSAGRMPSQLGEQLKRLQRLGIGDAACTRRGRCLSSTRAPGRRRDNRAPR